MSPINQYLLSLSDTFTEAIAEPMPQDLWLATVALANKSDTF